MCFFKSLEDYEKNNIYINNGNKTLLFINYKGF